MMFSVDQVESPSAAALVRLAESRDAEAWQLLVERHGTAMYRAAFAITRDAHLAADACQEAFLLVRDGASRFKPRGGDAEAAAQGWLVRVATTTALMLLRGTRRRQSRERAIPATLPAPVSESAGDNDERLAEAVRAEIAALPETYREALLLHAYAGLDYPAIACALGTSAGNARVRVHRALTRLRARLARVGAAGGLLPSLTPAVLPPGLTARCLGLLHAPITPTVSLTALHGGLTIMTKFAIAAAALAVCGSLALPFARAGAEEHGAAPKSGEGHHQPPAALPVQDEREGQKGTIVGTVNEVDADKSVLIVTAVNGKRERYVPIGNGGSDTTAGGGLDQKVVAQLRTLHAGDRVSLDWIFSERLRVVGVKALDQSNAPSGGPKSLTPVYRSGGGEGQP